MGVEVQEVEVVWVEEWVEVETNPKYVQQIVGKLSHCWVGLNLMKYFNR
jgi:hypothetical protein